MWHSARTALQFLPVHAAELYDLLLYFWFRSTVNRYGLPEAFFQKVERHWDAAMDEINRYIDAQAEADRRHA